MILVIVIKFKLGGLLIQQLPDSILDPHPIMLTTKLSKCHVPVKNFFPFCLWLYNSNTPIKLFWPHDLVCLFS